MSDHVEVAREGGVLRLTLARPEKKNALTGAMYERLIEALREADGDPAIGAVLIAGSGGSFTAGNDIGDFLTTFADVESAPAFRFVRSLAACETPLVAAVHGAAVGIGTTLLLHCDLAYAAPDALFRMPFVDLGLVPEAASSLLLPRRVGMLKATELLLLGEALRADAALRLGLLNDVVAADRLLAHALERAQALAGKPRAAVAATRRLLRGDRAEILARIDAEAQAFATALRSFEARAAFAAFMARPKTQAGA